MPLLDEDEGKEIHPLLSAGIRELKEYRKQTHESLTEALGNNQGLPVLLKYKELTGYAETNINAIWHHRRSDFGPECPNCGKLFRTPRAKFCAECGYKHSDSK
jgi:hypothetical protein